MSRRVASSAVLSVLLTTVLVVSTVTPATAAPEEEDTNSSSSIPSVPTMDAGGDPDTESSAPAGSFKDAPPVGLPEAPPAPEPVQGAQTDLSEFADGSQPVVDRDEFSTTYEGPDDSLVSAVSPTPLNVKDDSGGWVPIETDLSTTGPWSWLGQGGAEVQKHPLKPEFAEYADDANLLTMTRGDDALTFGLDGAAHSVLERDLAPWSEEKNHLEYKNVFENVVLPNLIIGPIAIIVGALVFHFRQKIRDHTVNSEKAALGDRAGDRLGQLQTPFWVGVAGIGGVVVGLVMIVGGLSILVTT